MKFIPTFPYKPVNGLTTNSVSCTPDGYFAYISARIVSFVKPGENPLIKVFNTKQSIVAIDIDPSWNTEGKLFATLTHEKSILIWDFEKGYAVSGHKAHCRMQSKAIEGAEKQNCAVHMSFMKNRNLLSLCSNDLVVYCVASNSICVRPKFAPGKGQVLTALKCSPYNEHIFALGTNRGQVYICDLQKMAILYTLGRHQTPVASLSWNRISVSKDMPKVVKKVKPPLAAKHAVEDNDDIFNIYDYDYLENEFGAPVKTEASNDAEAESSAAKISLNPNFNFQEACESLKQEINALNENVDVRENMTVDCDAVTLEDCRSTKNAPCLSSMCESESTEGSLELVEHRSSSDESRHVDGREIYKNKVSTEHEIKHEEVGDTCETKGIMKEKETGVDEENSDVLLASASTDCHVWIWNTETGGCCDNLKAVSRKNSKGNANVHIIWYNTTKLYALDAQGEIHQWCLANNSPICSSSKRSYKFEKLPNNRTDVKTLAFGISNDSNLWYISSKKEIVCENIETAETILHYATATTGNAVACESPENNSKIAFGFADGNIALLETSQLSSTKIVIQTLQARLGSFAKTLAWNDDGCNIAYGTNEGQVGYVNIDTQKHTTFHTFHAKPVYSIQWRGEDIFMVCFCNLFVYKTGNRDPFTLQGVNSSVSTVSIRHGYILLGTNRGEIEVYCENTTDLLLESRTLRFNLLHSIEVAKHYITDIAWNPLKDTEFAVAANEKCINILSLNITEGTVSLIRKIDFGVPKAVVSSVKWSNRDAERLVTAGFDGALRVFDLSRPSNEELVFVKQFHCPLYSAMLLPRDEKYALCTGRFITVEIVDTSRSDDKMANAKSESTLDHIKWAAKISIGSSTAGNKKKDKQAAKKPVTTHSENVPINELTEQVSELVITKTQITSNAQELVKNSTHFLKTPQTLMNLITKEHNKNPLENLQRYLSSRTSHNSCVETVLTSQLFGRQKDALNVLSAELEKVKTQTTVAELGNIFLSQIKGDIRNVILNAIQTRQLNEWHVALSPTISYSFWQKCCRAFAEQLLEQGYALQAATYMLGLHKQRDAIDMLVKANFCKEALLIARAYLPENDPLLAEITSKWIEQLENHGNLAGAAFICAVSNQYMRGYEILSKQRNIGTEEATIINLLKEMGTA